jgi:hypothetical protein
MEELKLLIDMVADLPAMAVWVLVGFLAYKLVVVGSIYGVIRLCIVKFHDWATKPRVVSFKVGAKAIDEATAEALNAQIARLNGGHYLHMTDVQKLREALDVKLKGN